MKGLKRYFSPPQVSERNGKVGGKDGMNGNVSSCSNMDEEKKTIVNNNDHSKEMSISGDLIVKNMEEVLKSISKKRKKEKHKRRHHKDKKRSEKEEVKDKAASASHSNGSDKKLEETNGVPDNNKENDKKQPMTMNAFQVMMNARKQSIGSNLNGIEDSEATTSNSSNTTSQRNSHKRKRKEMLQEWADAKGGRARKESDEAGERFVKKELQKRATRLKDLLTNGKKAEKEEDEPFIDDSDDEDFEPTRNKSLGKGEKKRTKRRKINFNAKDDDSQETERKNFTSKLRSPLKKRDSLLGYFSKVSKNDESPGDKKELETPEHEKPKKGRPRRQEKVEDPVSEPVDITTPPKKTRERQIPTKDTPEAQTSDLDTPQNHPTDNGSAVRPRRSCTLAPKSYKFESSPNDKKKQDVKKVDEDPTIILSDENSSETTPPLHKLASIFHKKVPKPAVDPEVVRARQDFLRSGLPETIRQEIDRQKEFEEAFLNDVRWFPSVSHVTQVPEEDETRFGRVDWSLSRIKVGAGLTEDDQWEDLPLNLGILSEAQVNGTKPELSWCHVKDRKAAGRKLKLVFDTFPTYKCFHQLHEKQKDSQEGVSSSGELFTERYKPMSSAQFLINGSPVASLKKFLSAWKDSKEAANDSDDDFEGSSRDSRSSVSSSVVGSNVILIYGPCGSGKTSSVLALADEMHFNVLEINAGAKRTGKKMLQELQEATQSHQLRKGQDEKRNKKLKRQKSSEQEANKKISLILIEDADVIFEQDDGFISGISQLVAISKRPVILTAIDPSLPHLSSYLNQNSIEFRPPSPSSASKYLTVMCLAENYIVNDHEIRKLYEESNNGDMRKTILQLQFYLQTGGDLKGAIEPSPHVTHHNNDEEMIEVIPVSEDDMNEIDDEHSKFSTSSYEDHVTGAPIEHQHCQFYKFFGDQHKICKKPSTKGTSLTEICATNEFISSVYTLRSPLGRCPDRLTPDLNEEILEFLSYEDGKQPESKSPKLSNNLPSCVGSSSSRDNQLDYEPILREICRTEKQRLTNERKGSRFYHYLRSLNPNSFTKDYFDQFTSILKDN